MTNDDIDRILSREEELLPSVGFSARVMDAVRSETSAPPPIAFPWRRAWPGLAAAGLALVSLFAGLAKPAREALAAPPSAMGPPVIEPFLRAMLHAGVGPVVIALLVSLASVKLAMRLAAS
jgi:hypothetical protein